jgi:hypothetical protein
VIFALINFRINEKQEQIITLCIAVGFEIWKSTQYNIGIHSPVEIKQCVVSYFYRTWHYLLTILKPYCPKSNKIMADNDSVFLFILNYIREQWTFLMVTINYLHCGQVLLTTLWAQRLNVLCFPVSNQKRSIIQIKITFVLHPSSCKACHWPQLWKHTYI